MLSRALSLATVTLLIVCFAGGAARAQLTNLEAGKSPSQIFAGTCNACHKSPRGLLKTVPASSLPGYLRQHYTTSSDMASVLASFLVSNGATDTRYQGKDQPKTDLAKGGKEGAKPEGARQEAARPDADGLAPQGEGAARPGRDAKRLARPGQAPDGTKPADGQAPTQAATDSKMGAKQKLGKRGRPGTEEPPKSDEAAKDEASKRDTAKVDSGKGEVDKPEAGQTRKRGQARSRQIRDRQGRCVQRIRWQRADAVAARSGSAGYASAAGLGCDRQHDARAGCQPLGVSCCAGVAARRDADTAGGDGLRTPAAASSPGGTAGATDFPIDLATGRPPAGFA